MTGTNRHIGYTTYTPKKHLQSVDAHVQNGAGNLFYTVLPRNAAIKLVIDSSNQVTFQLPYLLED